ncbi:MAG: cyclic pyranopterin monophosphate synthase MoaC [Pseudomonadota bacterium]|nr:cyclic pyranopterin monophosphate synthase MoaC [Pseudomonadota bacterium]
MTRLTHMDAAGNARMVEVGEKEITRRSATAEGWVRLSAEALAQLRTGADADGAALPGGSKKGDVLGVAQVAGILGAKRTADLIPLCHPLPLDGVDLTLDASAEGVRIVATARCTGRTGVEMEALTAVTVAALTVYDMLKAVDRGIRIDGVRLLEKTGGRSGHWRAS